MYTKEDTFISHEFYKNLTDSEECTILLIYTVIFKVFVNLRGITKAYA